MLIEIHEEDIFNLRIAEKRLRESSEPWVDLEIFSIQAIIQRYETQTQKNTPAAQTELTEDKMEIANSIMDIVERKEKNDERLFRCLKALICPKCGKALRVETINEPPPADSKYICDSCGLEHKEPDV